MEEYIFFIAVGSFNNQSKMIELSDNKLVFHILPEIRSVWMLMNSVDAKYLVPLVKHSGDARLRQVYDRIKDIPTLESAFMDGIMYCYPSNHVDILGL